MRIIGSSFRSGTSTVFGVLIFVGIMFTAVIPMFLVMRQADTFYEKSKYEVGRLDEERVKEEIYFYLETEIGTEPIITLKIKNRGELAVRITRVWINYEPRPVNYFIPPISESEFELRDLIDPELPPAPVSFSILIVTDKGNIFSPYSGTPTYNPGSGGSWEHDFYTIYIMMTHLESQLHIFVKVIDGAVCFDYDVDNNQPGYTISVPAPGFYQIVVTKLLGMPNERILIDTEREVSSDFPTALVII